MQISLLFDKAASVILEESEFEDCICLEIVGRLTEIGMKFSQTNLSDGTRIILNICSLILLLELRSRIDNNQLNLMENLKCHHSPSDQKSERVK